MVAEEEDKAIRNLLSSLSHCDGSDSDSLPTRSSRMQETSATSFTKGKTKPIFEDYFEEISRASRLVGLFFVAHTNLCINQLDNKHDNSVRADNDALNITSRQRQTRDSSTRMSADEKEANGRNSSRGRIRPICRTVSDAVFVPNVNDYFSLSGEETAMLVVSLSFDAMDL